MMRHLKTISVRGFKSIQYLEHFNIHTRNILIGSNDVRRPKSELKNQVIK